MLNKRLMLWVLTIVCFLGFYLIFVLEDNTITYVGENNNWHVEIYVNNEKDNFFQKYKCKFEGEFELLENANNIVFEIYIDKDDVYSRKLTFDHHNTKDVFSDFFQINSFGDFSEETEINMNIGINNVFESIVLTFSAD